MRLSAYILLGDPSWLAPSVRSYYKYVTRIVASYDRNFCSWSGVNMAPEIAECLRLVKADDPEGKVTLLPGPFACPGEHPQIGETRQRQASLLAAADFGDWILQLDTDEIVLDPAELCRQIAKADDDGVDGLEYPARWIYTHVSRNWFLEMGTRRLGTWDAIPGPVAVRAGIRLRLARQADVTIRKLRMVAGDAQVPVRSAILHFSMVRSVASMHNKAAVSPHAPDLDWQRRLRLWEDARAHPIRAIAQSIIRPEFGSYRLARLPAPFGADLVAREVSVGDPVRLRAPIGVQHRA